MLELVEGDLRQQVLAALSDVIVLLDDGGVIEDVRCESAALQNQWSKDWTGKAWKDTVTVESIPKIKDLLASTQDLSSRRQVNHPEEGHPDIPMTYVTMPLSYGGWLAFGRDMRAISEMQQQLVQYQVEKERDYARLRAFETRFRILAEAIEEPLLVVRAADFQITEHNRAAKDLLAPKTKRQMIGRQLLDMLTGDASSVAQDVLSMARTSGRAQSVEMTIAGSNYRAETLPFRQEGTHLVIVRLDRIEQPTATKQPGLNGSAKPITLPGALERIPDGIVTTDIEGNVLAANDAFVELTELAHADQVVGENLSRWLGRPDIDLGVLLGKLRSEGRVKAYGTTFSGNYGTIAQIEVSAAIERHSKTGTATFVFRDLGSRPRSPLSTTEALPHSADELTRLVGHVPLKELVRQTTDVIERLCIESALQITNENRASAAELLGLSRQGLYVKLRRYGIIDEVVEN